jgi:hypothetical protein
MLVTPTSPPFADTAAAIQAIFIAIVLAGGRRASDRLAP